MNPTTTALAAPAYLKRPVWGHWPAALGLAAATFQIVTGVATDAVALTVTVAASCYLAAAALGLRWIAWANILVGSIVAILSELAGAPWWLGLAVFAAVLVVVGLLRRTPVRPLSAEGLAMIGFGGLAVAAVLISPRLGLALAGVALASHAAWDYVHWRRDAVVPRSMAEFCIALDVVFGAAAITLAIIG
ncbi:hypothetical protein [Nocardioides luteus]|uniref:hypothetical protein n=1 Tax=Nocardioides luteus TaxID=1844 RepID=UPI0018CAEE4B|nr:hypothetical protein [Nocardioides luteus]MBG6096935.1 membrane protein implicated in regulation of membrane protease activity [Nocardioides luteus]